MHYAPRKAKTMLSVSLRKGGEQKICYAVLSHESPRQIIMMRASFLLLNFQRRSVVAFHVTVCHVHLFVDFKKSNCPFYYVLYEF